jgi:hypothetical protein
LLSRPKRSRNEAVELYEEEEEEEEEEDLIPFSPVDVYTCFGETYCSHLHGNTIKRACNKQQSECFCLLLVCSPTSMTLKM